MTLDNLSELLETIPRLKNKVTYRAWRAGQAPSLPFICYFETESDNFAADGIAYHKNKITNVELYTDFKDLSLETQIESLFDAAGIYWESDETYIDDEKMYMKVYEFEV